MSPTRYLALCALLRLGERDVARMTGFSRGAARKWASGAARVWPPLAAWLERVAPAVQALYAADPPPNRARLDRPPVPAAEARRLAARAAGLPEPLPAELTRAELALDAAARAAEAAEGADTAEEPAA
jgi:hypothetical protein